jgi:hypothetical protein
MSGQGEKQGMPDLRSDVEGNVVCPLIHLRCFDNFLTRHLFTVRNLEEIKSG